MPLSRVNTECSIHWVMHHPKISPAPSKSLTSHLSADLVVCNSPYSHNYKLMNWLSLSCMLRLAPYLPPPDRLPPVQQSPSTPPISVRHGLQVQLQTCSISASMSMSKLAPSWPSSTSPMSLDHSLYVHLNIYMIAVWSNHGALKYSEENAWERDAFAQGRALDEGHRIWRGTRLWGTSQTGWIREDLARVHEEQHKLCESL